MNKKPAAHSIINQLTASLLISILFVSITISIILGVLFIKNAQADLEEEANKSIKYLCQILQQPMWYLDNKQVLAIGKTYEIDTKLTNLVIKGHDGTIIYKFAKNDNNKGVRVSDTINYKDRKLGTVEMTFSSKEYQEGLKNFLYSTLLLIVLIIITTYVVNRFLIRKFLSSPLEDLTVIVNSYSNGNYNANIENFKCLEFLPFANVLFEMGQEINNQLEERKRLFTAIDQAGDGIVITDSKGVIQYCNPSFMEMTQYSRKELIGSNTSILKSGKHDNEMYKELWETICSGKRWVGHFTNRKKDGTLYEEDCSISPILLSDNTVSNFVAIKRDVTEEMRLQAHIHQSQKMEAMGTLAGGIAHDFNNILGAIIGFSEILKEEYEDDPRANRLLEPILNGSLRAADLVKQILTFARISDREKVPVKIKDILKDALKLIRASLPTTIEIIESIESDSQVDADPTEIHQIIMNLCTNAKLAMPTGGVLDINLKDIEVDEDFSHRHNNIKSGSYIQLSISDNGTGMTKELQSKIFDPFFTTRKTGEGTGMGLSVVHGIIDEAGGVITVYSEPGVGTSFKVLLPITNSVVQIKKEENKPLPTGNERILFIDDEKTLLDLAMTLLEPLGYKVTTSLSSTEAFEIFKKDPDAFDLVISDTTMPNLTGDVLCRKIKEIRSDIPFILCSGFNERVNKDIAESIGAFAFLMKPIVKRTLAETVRNALDSEK